MFPYHDENETQRPAYVTMAFVAINVFMWVVVQGAGSALPLATSVCNLGLIPAELTGALPPGAGFPMGDGLVCLTDPGRQPINVLTSMFLHGSWMHLLGNMWFLWLFGNNVEDAMTRVRFVIFYLACGLAAACASEIAWCRPLATCAMATTKTRSKSSSSGVDARCGSCGERAVIATRRLAPGMGEWCAVDCGIAARDFIG